MSWSASFTIDDADASFSTEAHPQVGYAEEESKAAIAAATDYARQMVRDGLGGANGPYKVEIGGHANPDGVPQAGWAEDTIFVRVTGFKPTPQGS